MRTWTWPLLALAALALALPPHPRATALEGEEARLVQLINEHRARHGIGPLAVDDALTAAAAWLSADMLANGYFSHTDSLGRRPWQRAQEFGFPGSLVGETIYAAGGSSAEAVQPLATAEAVFESWRASPGHDAIMLDAAYTHIGVGRACGQGGDGYRCYWTADFGVREATAAPSGWGDLDCDGTVTAADALLVRRHLAGLPSSPPSGCPAVGSATQASGAAVIWGDVDGNGQVDDADALCLLRYRVGLPCPGAP